MFVWFQSRILFQFYKFNDFIGLFIDTKQKIYRLASDLKNVVNFDRLRFIQKILVSKIPEGFVFRSYLNGFGISPLTYEFLA